MPREKFNYFDALERQGNYACEEAAMLVDVLKNFDPDTLLEKVKAIHEIENAADNQNHEIFTHVAIEFLTPLEREDIVELAHRLDDIADYIDDVMQLLYMYNIQDVHEHALEMAEIIVRTTTALVAALKEFRNFRRAKKFTDFVIVVNELEEEADNFYFLTVRDLYVNYADQPIYVLTWSNVFLRMERCIDACENTVDLLGTVVLKNR
ncbi:MAG: DUF47 family protein [Eggerthellaceae bacterium]|nr:DUF47 family protein [Eggerthellaceae bacterium]